MKFKPGDILKHKTSGELCVYAKELPEGYHLLSRGFNEVKEFSEDYVESVFELTK